MLLIISGLAFTPLYIPLTLPIFSSMESFTFLGNYKGNYLCVNLELKSYGIDRLARQPDRSGLNSEISLVHRDNLQDAAFSIGLPNECGVCAVHVNIPPKSTSLIFLDDKTGKTSNINM